MNLKQCTYCYAVIPVLKFNVASETCFNLPDLILSSSSAAPKDTWHPNAQVGPWAAEAPWTGQRQPRSLDTAPLLCLSQAERSAEVHAEEYVSRLSV